MLTSLRIMPTFKVFKGLHGSRPSAASTTLPRGNSACARALWLILRMAAESSTIQDVQRHLLTPRVIDRPGGGQAFAAIKDLRADFHRRQARWRAAAPLLAAGWLFHLPRTRYSGILHQLFLSAGLSVAAPGSVTGVVEIGSGTGLATLTWSLGALVRSGMGNAALAT